MINFAHNKFLKISGLFVVVPVLLVILLIASGPFVQVGVGALFLWSIIGFMSIVSFFLSIVGIIISGLRIRRLDNVDKIFAVIFVLFVSAILVYYALF